MTNENDEITLIANHNPNLYWLDTNEPCETHLDIESLLIPIIAWEVRSIKETKRLPYQQTSGHDRVHFMHAVSIEPPPDENYAVVNRKTRAWWVAGLASSQGYETLRSYMTEQQAQRNREIEEHAKQQQEATNDV